jgi:hypothetical protein
MKFTMTVDIKDEHQDDQSIRLSAILRDIEHKVADNDRNMARPGTNPILDASGVEIGAFGFHSHP